MKLLLDTCTFLWACSAEEKLSENARNLFQNPDNEVYLSVASCWEISIKYHLKKLVLRQAPDTLIPKLRDRYFIASLPISEAAALHIHRLPTLHRDPFDRMLVAQATMDGMPILTPDELIAQYPVTTIW